VGWFRPIKKDAIALPTRFGATDHLVYPKCKNLMRLKT